MQYVHYSSPKIETIHKLLFIYKSKKYINTKQSNKRNNQNSKDKRQDYNMK